MLTKDDVSDFMQLVGDTAPLTSFDMSYQTPQEFVTEFADAMDQDLDKPWSKDCDLGNFRMDLIREEMFEACDALDAEHMLKELADLVYVTYGYAATFGWDLDEAVSRVHQSNMSKLLDDGEPLKDSRGKVMKGPNYQKAKLGDLV